MSSTVKASYSLHIPKGIINSAQNPSSTLVIPVEKSQDMHEYYNNLRDAVLATKLRLGEELTSWRDAIGTSENLKEAEIVKKKSGVDEDSEEVDDV